MADPSHHEPASGHAAAPSAHAGGHDAGGHDAGGHGHPPTAGFAGSTWVVALAWMVLVVGASFILRSHPAVRDVAVVGVPSATWGESPVAFVVPGDAPPSAPQLQAWANERLGKTQRLVDLRFLPELPRNDIGKVLKRQLRDAYA